MGIGLLLSLLLIAIAFVVLIVAAAGGWRRLVHLLLLLAGAAAVLIMLRLTVEQSSGPARAAERELSERVRAEVTAEVAAARERATAIAEAQLESAVRPLDSGGLVQRWESSTSRVPTQLPREARNELREEELRQSHAEAREAQRAARIIATRTTRVTWAGVLTTAAALLGALWMLKWVVRRGPGVAGGA